MKSIPIDSNTWQPLEMGYAHDSSIKLNSKIVSNLDNVPFSVTPIASGAKDIKINNFSEVMLSNTVHCDQVYDLVVDRNIYPKTYTTYLLLNSYPNIQPESSYLMIIPASNDNPTRNYITREGVDSAGNPLNSEFFTNDTNNNNIYFNLTLHNERELSISHDDNHVTTFLTTTGKPQNDTLQFVFSAAPMDIPGENQKFRYIEQNEDGYILLSKLFDNVVYYITVTKSGSKFTALKAGENADQTYPYLGVIRTVPQTKTSVNLQPDNNWVSYKTTGNQNNLRINKSKSIENIRNNYVVSTQYSTITGKTISCDMLPLKNQLTPSNKILRGNPFPNFDQSDHREYNKLFTGTNEARGNEHIIAGYDSYQTEIDLLPDTITYFHTPQDMYPYEKLNINDSGLIEAGAIGGDTPIVSDKIFKKAADYKNNTPYGAPSDEETGVWLCSWLKSNIGTAWDPDIEYNEDIIVNYKGEVYQAIESNKGVEPDRDARIWLLSEESKPIWVDRYYNPAAFSAKEALRIENQYSDYISKYEYIINTLSAEDIYVFDKISDLTFEPGCSYAYYRVGPQENKVTIDNIEKLVHSGQTPVYNNDRVQQNLTTPEMKFNGDRYIETSNPANIKDSSCTISFNLHSIDWTKPFAGQIIGNYVNEGISFYNKQNLTPYNIIRKSDTTDLYNTNMDLVLSIPRSCLFVCHGNGNENVSLFCKDGAKYYIHQYDTKGMLIESTELYDLENKQIESVCMDEQAIYILDDSNDVRKYDVNNESRDRLFRTNPGYTVGGEDHVMENDYVFPVSDQTYIHRHNDLTYRINCDYYSIDMDDNIWFTKGKDVWKFIPSDRRGANATFVGVVNGATVSLIAEEFIKGSIGNKIKLTGDGTNTVATLVSNWNNSHPDNKLQIVDPLGASTVPPVDYEMQLSGGIDIGQAITFHSHEAVDFEIKGISCDYDNNVWILGVSTAGGKIWKFDNDRNLIFEIILNTLDVKLNGINEQTKCVMDFTCEINKTDGYTHYPVIYIQSGDDAIKLNLTTDGVMSGCVSVSDIPDIESQYNITNYEVSKSLNRGAINTNHLIFKTRFQSYFDTDKTYSVQMKYNLEELTPGEHHFAIGFNADNSNISLFVDGNLHQTIKSDDIFTGAAYKFSKTIHAPLHVGVETYFNNITFSEYLGLDNYGYAVDNTISNIRVYNSYLNFYKIKSLTRETNNILPLSLVLPTGRRNYVDKMQKYYRHRTPGRRSDVIDVDIIAENDNTEKEVKLKLSEDIRDIVRSALPVNKSIREVVWTDE